MRGIVSCMVLTVIGTWGASAWEDVTSTKEAAVRELFQEMLHIQPPVGPRGSPGRPSAPRHMLELYQQYTSTSREPTESVATTIRNILPLSGPMPGSIGSKDLLFNVSCVQDTEEVRLAQLQLNRRKLHQRHNHKRLLAPPFRVRLYQVTPTRLVPLASVPVSMVQRSAWASVDITAALKELLLDPRVSRRILAVRFESPSGKQIPPSHFLRGVPNTPHAFLVVFAEDSEENLVSEDGTQPAPRPPVHTHAMVQKLQQGPHAALFLGEDEVNDLQVIPLLDEARKAHMFTRNNTKRVNTLQTPPVYSDNAEVSGNKLPSGALIRKLRSIIDNQLPDDDDNALDNQVGKTLPASMMSPCQHVEGNKKKNKKGKKGKRNKGKKGGMQASPSFIKAWQSETQISDTSKTGGAGEGGACAMRKMTLDFAEIGWADWIISPATFDANYCSGSCYPLSKATNPSNHAAVQSYVHSLGLFPHVPAPSCVPHKLSSISVLYLDSASSVVLKNYPGMVVKSCACR